jgi:H+/gluconate symporter-like permease
VRKLRAFPRNRRERGNCTAALTAGFSSPHSPIWNNLPVTPTAVTTAGSWYLVACAAGAVLLLLILIARVRLHPALALAVAAVGLGVAAGMPLKQIPISFTTGVGNLMGHIAIVLGLGAVLGRLLASSGGAAALGKALVDGCGPKGLPWALLLVGIVVGMPVFFEVGLVLLMPIVAESARRSGRPPILVGMPLLAGLSIVHGTLPPHPAAMLAVAQYHADLGKTILLGLCAGLPAAVVAGPVLGWLMLRRWERTKGKSTLIPANEETCLRRRRRTRAGCPRSRVWDLGMNIRAGSPFPLRPGRCARRRPFCCLLC